MNRLLVILYVDCSLCLLFAGAQDEKNMLPWSFIKHSYFLTTTPPDTATSTTAKPILNTNKNKRTIRRKVIGEIFGTPSSSSAPFEIPEYILNTVFGPKFGTPKNETPTTIAEEPPDRQNSTDTSNLADRFLTVGLLKFLYDGPENQVNDNPTQENRNDNRQGLISERRITIGARVQNDTNSLPETKNAANLIFINSLLILFEYFIVVNVF